MIFDKIDLFLLGPAILLSLLGSLTLTSVYPQAFPQHYIYLAFAVAAFFTFSHIDIRLIRQLSPFWYIACLLLLIGTLTFGQLTRGSARWINFSTITLQPSEVLKPALILFIAHLIANSKSKKKFLVATLLSIPSIALVFLQPDLGSTLVLLAGLFGVFFLGNIPLKTILTFLLALGLGIPILAKTLADYQKERIMSFLSPAQDPLGTGYNAIQAIIAVGSGGFLGKGLGQGTQSQLAFLPERHTDFIFASLSEELGFFGSALVISSFCILFSRLIYLTRKTDDVFMQSLLGGIFAIFFAHSVVNIGMNLGVLPITGIPLPFVSSGGSALISMSVMLGIASQIASKLKHTHPSGIINLHDQAT